jgi:hypothetical protein
MVVAIVLFIAAPPFGAVVEILFLVMLAIIFYGLYVAHRSEWAGLSLAGLVLGILALVTNLVSMANYGNTVLSNLWYLMLSLPLAVFGFLGYRSGRMPRVLSVLILLAGILFLVTGVGGFAVGAEFSDNISLIPFVMLVVSLVWLSRVFRFLSHDDALT